MRTWRDKRITAVFKRTPPSNASAPDALPRFASDTIDSVPARSVVPPVYVLAPLKTRVPVPALVRAPLPETWPAMVMALPPVWTVTLPLAISASSMRTPLASAFTVAEAPLTTSTAPTIEDDVARFKVLLPPVKRIALARQQPVAADMPARMVPLLVMAVPLACMPTPPAPDAANRRGCRLRVSLIPWIPPGPSRSSFDVA